MGQVNRNRTICSTLLSQSLSTFSQSSMAFYRRTTDESRTEWCVLVECQCQHQSVHPCAACAIAVKAVKHSLCSTESSVLSFFEGGVQQKDAKVFVVHADRLVHFEDRFSNIQTVCDSSGQNRPKQKSCIAFTCGDGCS